MSDPAYVCMHYLYRDASNFKAYGEVWFAGELNPSVDARLRERLEGGDFFVAEQVDVPPLHNELWAFSGGPTAADHAYHQFVGLEARTELPEGQRLWGALPDFIERVEQVTRWNVCLSPNARS